MQAMYRTEYKSRRPAFSGLDFHKQFSVQPTSEQQSSFDRRESSLGVYFTGQLTSDFTGWVETIHEPLSWRQGTIYTRQEVDYGCLGFSNAAAGESLDFRM